MDLEGRHEITNVRPPKTDAVSIGLDHHTSQISFLHDQAALASTLGIGMLTQAVCSHEEAGSSPPATF